MILYNLVDTKRKGRDMTGVICYLIFCSFISYAGYLAHETGKAYDRSIANYQKIIDLNNSVDKIK